MHASVFAKSSVVSNQQFLLHAGANNALKWSHLMDAVVFSLKQ